MAGIAGMNFSEHALKEIRNIYCTQKWPHWTIYHIDNDANIIDLSVMGINWDDNSPQDTWAQFVRFLPNDQCRYALCNFDYTSSKGISKSKIVFVMWAPNTANVKNRLQIAMHNRDVQKQIKEIGGITVSLQANEISDLDYDLVLKKLQSVCCLTF